MALSVSAVTLDFSSNNMWPFARKRLADVAFKLEGKELIDWIFERIPVKGEMTDIQKGVFGLWWLRAEILNGTIDQYFSNSTAGDLPRLIEFLEQIGGTELLDALVPVCEIFMPDLTILDRYKRIEICSDAWENREDEWSAFIRQVSDDVLMAYPVTYSKATDYIRSSV